MFYKLTIVRTSIDQLNQTKCVLKIWGRWEILDCLVWPTVKNSLLKALLSGKAGSKLEERGGSENERYWVFAHFSKYESHRKYEA